MSTVGLFVHPGRPAAIALAATVRAWLEARGHQVEDGPQPSPAIDLVVAIGGDGTVLRSARVAVESDADVLGINLGELGYLAEVEPDAWEAALTAYFAGDHRIQERMLVTSSIGGGAPLHPALNEVVIEKQAIGRTVRLAVWIDGAYFTSYVADGVIVSTPTGSTAYSLSARGPIVDPSHRALILTPVSPHSLFDRSLVLGPDSVVEIEVTGDRDAAISIDGQQAGTVRVGQRVRVASSPEPARIAHLGGRTFHQVLKAKFGLSDR